MYIGPETIAPLTSGAAAVAGAALLFGRRVARFVRSSLGGGKVPPDGRSGAGGSGGRGRATDD